MSANGIAYKNLLRIATKQQILQLCEPELRMLVQVGPDNNSVDATVLMKIAREAVDLGYASKLPEGQEVLFSLIKEYSPDTYVQDMAAYADIPHTDEGAVAEHYRSKPSLLENFLGWQFSQEGFDLASENLSGPVTPAYGLRYYQLVGVRAIVRKLASQGRCLYQAPTGAGKTRTAMAVVARHFIENGPTNVLWLASTTELIDQACQAFKREWASKGDIESVLYAWRGGGARFNPSCATNKNTMLVASLQLLTVRSAEVEALKDQVTLVVFDEAHQSIAQSYKRILELYLSSDKCKLLGLSATPSRAEGEEASEALARLYHNNKIRIFSNNANPIEYLVKHGYLADTHFEKFSYSLRNYQQPNTQSVDYNDQFLDWLGKNAARNLEIVKYVKHVLDQGRQRILVFCPTILSAQYCSKALKVLHNVACSYHISGKTSRRVRERHLAKFTGNDPNPVVLFNCQVLTTGFDAPLTDAVIIARPTKSAPLYAQMIGRALRGPQSGGTETAYIYNFADQQLVGYNKLADLFSSFDQAWIEPEKSKQ